MKIYLASSWENMRLPGVMHVLRRCGHDVYDFKRPTPATSGYRMSNEPLASEAFHDACSAPGAVNGLNMNLLAIRLAQAFVLVLPSDLSAAAYYGYALAEDKLLYVLCLDQAKPELAFAKAKILLSMNDVFDTFEEPKDEY